MNSERVPYVPNIVPLSRKASRAAAQAQPPQVPPAPSPPSDATLGALKRIDDVLHTLSVAPGQPNVARVQVPLPAVPRRPGRNVRPWGPDLDGGHYRAPTPWFPVRIDASGLRAMPPQAAGQALAPAVKQALGDANLGALVVRGLSFQRGEEISAFFDALGFCVPAGRWGAGRDVEDGLFDVTAVPPSAILPLHNEPGFAGGQRLDKIAFVCLAPAADGGETLLGRGQDIADSLGGDVFDAVAQHQGVRSRRWLPSQARAQHIRLAASDPTQAYLVRSWSEFFATPSISHAEALLGTMGFEMASDGDGGMYVTSPPQSLYVDDDVTGQPTWYNFGTFSECFPYQTFLWGDGTPMDTDTLFAIKNARTRCTYALALEAGEMILLNNQRVQHGRAPFKDTGRRMRVVPG